MFVRIFQVRICLDHLNLKPSLIVLDYYLGEGESTAMSGLDTLKKINETNSNIPVVILSREKDKALIREFLHYGAIRYVIKDDFFINTLIEPSRIILWKSLIRRVTGTSDK